MISWVVIIMWVSIIMVIVEIDKGYNRRKNERESKGRDREQGLDEDDRKRIEKGEHEMWVEDNWTDWNRGINASD